MPGCAAGVHHRNRMLPDNAKRVKRLTPPAIDFSLVATAPVRYTRRMKLTAYALIGILPLLARGAEIPEPVLPAGVGVNIHFVTGQEKDLDLIAAAGFKFVRMDFAWEAIETSKGEYNWAGYEELLANLEKRGLRAFFILDYSHHLYEEL